MRAELGALTALCLALTAACAGPSTAELIAERRARLIERALPHLTPAERAELESIEGDARQVRYLSSIGVEAELALCESLRPGLAMPEVEASLGIPEDRETEQTQNGRFEYWTYRGQAPPPIEVRGVLQFRDGRLLGWKVERRAD